jgi:hypothetical protein
MNCRIHWILFVINISDECVYVLNPMNHDVNGLRIKNAIKYKLFIKLTYIE